MVDMKKLLDTGDPETIVKEARALAEALSNAERGGEERDASKTQVRRLYGTFRQIQMAWPVDAKPEQIDKAYRELILFGPRLAYQRSRHRGLRDLTDALQAGITLVGKDRKRLQTLGDFFEATVAYFSEKY
jgi:CRISPR type III-A-associated protein Csm2